MIWYWIIFILSVDCILHQWIKFQIQSIWYKNIINKHHMPQNISYVYHIPSVFIHDTFEQHPKLPKFGSKSSSLEENVSKCQFHNSMHHNTTKHCTMWCCLKLSILSDEQMPVTQSVGRSVWPLICHYLIHIYSFHVIYIIHQHWIHSRCIEPNKCAIVPKTMIVHCVLSTYICIFTWTMLSI